MVSVHETFSTATVQGLSEVEARRRLKEGGPNELPQRESRGFIRTALEVVREPMILLVMGSIPTEMTEFGVAPLRMPFVTVQALSRWSSRSTT